MGSEKEIRAPEGVTVTWGREEVAATSRASKGGVGRNRGRGGGNGGRRAEPPAPVSKKSQILFVVTRPAAAGSPRCAWFGDARGWDRMGTAGKGVWVVGGRWPAGGGPASSARIWRPERGRPAGPTRPRLHMPRSTSRLAADEQVRELGLGMGMGMTCAQDHMGW